MFDLESLQLLRELGDEALILLVQYALVVLHLHTALLLQLKHAARGQVRSGQIRSETDVSRQDSGIVRPRSLGQEVMTSSKASAIRLVTMIRPRHEKGRREIQKPEWTDLTGSCGTVVGSSRDGPRCAHLDERRLVFAAHAFVAGHLLVHLLLHVLLLLTRDERRRPDGGKVVTVRLRLPEGGGARSAGYG